MKSSVEELKKIVPPPKSPINAGSLERFVEIEKHLAIQLPTDYKELITTYGDGYWQGFWWMFNPFSENEFISLLKQASTEGDSGHDTLSAERYLKNLKDDYPHVIWPDKGGIFPWAGTDNGGRFFWITEGEPDRWPTIYYPSRDPDFERYEISAAEIILGAVSGKLPIFEEEFRGGTTVEGSPLFEPFGV